MYVEERSQLQVRGPFEAWLQVNGLKLLKKLLKLQFLPLPYTARGLLAH